uniref:Deacetylase sirtuin-type domain-containing protein n=1 Tax=Alexandrium monilatum TaxID=311494 RepID=A0A7S4RN87_9DINO
MSTAAGIPDFRSPGGLYGTSSKLLERFTYLENGTRSVQWQRSALEDDVKSALTHRFFSVNPLPYHEMRRGFILGLGEGQWKPTIAHVFPEILHRNGKLHLLASQNIDGLDHRVMSDPRKLYNPHGLMSTLVSEQQGILPVFMSTDPKDPVYQRYVQLVKSNIRDIYSDLPARRGKSSHLWPGPEASTPITLEMFGDLLPPQLAAACGKEQQQKSYSVKPGSVLFDRMLWTTNAAGEPCDAFDEVEHCDLVLVMGTSLSGLTIDNVAHMAGQTGIPRVVFDMTDAPINSLKGMGYWKPRNDCHLQTPLDVSVLTMLMKLGWLEQIFDFLPHLCLGSLKTLKSFIEQNVEDPGARTATVAEAIAKEEQRERYFYGDE